MKPNAYILVCIGCLGLALLGCTDRNDGFSAGSEPRTTTIDVTGTAGTLVIGSYLQDSRRVGFTNAVPFLISVDEPFELALRKANTKETVAVRAIHPGAEVSGTAGPGLPGLRVAATNGLELSDLSY